MPTFDTLYQKVLWFYAQPLSVLDADWKCLKSWFSFVLLVHFQVSQEGKKWQEKTLDGSLVICFPILFLQWLHCQPIWFTVTRFWPIPVCFWPVSKCSPQVSGINCFSCKCLAPPAGSVRWGAVSRWHRWGGVLSMSQMRENQFRLIWDRFVSTLLLMWTVCSSVCVCMHELCTVVQYYISTDSLSVCFWFAPLGQTVFPVCVLKLVWSVEKPHVHVL